MTLAGLGPDGSTCDGARVQVTPSAGAIFINH